ncbi:MULTISPECIES: ATP-binding protein [unclassified Thermoactinomyces]|uniref:ATP-binding protein n=1 Tax=unclassified Thermoactinomyces TaxID=2634588 RepID=UPI0018DDB16C|nr:MULTISPECIES: DUF87 domain-containing protein [unclassified Thermoactinomyces]MBH8583869.1 DUF87 domain-containing protein [Thermoactinomyces sp. CICC 10735]MBH8602053.1 DUF87 domain-containing protein [Thermoactinomyces sp. CICC 23799]
MDNFNQLLKEDELVKLVQNSSFVGWIYHIDYDYAKVMTNDLWKNQAVGIPHNCFLVAASFNPDQYKDVHEEDKQVILLRVVGSTKLPQDDDLVRAKIDYFQNQTNIYLSEDYDEITKNQMQFGGLDCRVIGTFYKRDGQLYLGSDLETFYVSTRLSVYRPRGEALQQIVNHIDPLQRKRSIENAKEQGFTKLLPPIQIGTVRYTSTDRLHRSSKEKNVPFTIFPYDFLARRTAVLGMTRTGKSNMIKKTVSVVKKIADEGNVKIGQIIFDINGEYANANKQDNGALANVYPDQTVRYRMIQTAGFLDLRNNFYEKINEGFNVIKRELQAANSIDADYKKSFINMSLEEPKDRWESAYGRWMRRVAAYQVLLYKAGFKSTKNFRVHFPANKDVRDIVFKKLGQENFKSFSVNEKSGIVSMNLPDANKWFEIIRNVKNELPKSKSGEPWVDVDLSNLLDMMVQKNSNNNYISGYKILDVAKKYHSPNRGRIAVGEEIYSHLREGKIVILDLSVGDPTIRKNISLEIAEYIFNKSMEQFIKDVPPPNIVIYIEEAHNLIGKNMDLTETWPRIAKEGAKYNIALVYATQEVSSIHPNILANTENWFVTHLNNEKEIKELTKFYDFADFSRSLLKAQDVGFARVKTLSSPFVVPVQIDLFKPE